MSKLTKERIAVMRRSHSFSATPAAEFNALCDLALSALEREAGAALATEPPASGEPETVCPIHSKTDKEVS